MVLVICKSLYLLEQYTGSYSVVLEIKTLVEMKGCAATQMDHSGTLGEISFHGLPS